MKLKVLKVIHGPDLMELWGGEVGLEKHTTYNPPPPFQKNENTGLCLFIQISENIKNVLLGKGRGEPFIK